MLTIRGTTEVNGKQEVVDQIITRFCALDKGAKAAAKPAAKKSEKNNLFTRQYFKATRVK